MKRIKRIFKKVFYPPAWILLPVVILSFSALIGIFAAHDTERITAYIVYFMSAYALVILMMPLPSLAGKVRTAISESALMKRIENSRWGAHYLHDFSFRGKINLYQGMAVSFAYAVFRLVTGIAFHSVWFLSIAVYYLILGGLRASLAYTHRFHDKNRDTRCYRRTAMLLFLLNIPMGGMIILMIHTNSGFTYPGYIIYLSALYTFYTVVLSIRNVLKFRKVGNLTLSAAKNLNLISALMSALGLQTAMIARFSTRGELYRKLMNTLTGSFVWGSVLFIAASMLLRSKSSHLHPSKPQK